MVFTNFTVLADCLLAANHARMWRGYAKALSDRSGVCSPPGPSPARLRRLVGRHLSIYVLRGFQSSCYLYIESRNTLMFSEFCFACLGRVRSLTVCRGRAVRRLSLGVSAIDHKVHRRRDRGSGIPSTTAACIQWRLIEPSLMIYTLFSTVDLLILSIASSKPPVSHPPHFLGMIPSASRHHNSSLLQLPRHLLLLFPLRRFRRQTREYKNARVTRLIGDAYVLDEGGCC